MPEHHISVSKRKGKLVIERSKPRSSLSKAAQNRHSSYEPAAISDYEPAYPHDPRYAASPTSEYVRHGNLKSSTHRYMNPGDDRSYPTYQTESSRSYVTRDRPDVQYLYQESRHSSRPPSSSLHPHATINPQNGHSVQYIYREPKYYSKYANSPPASAEYISNEYGSSRFESQRRFPRQETYSDYGEKLVNSLRFKGRASPPPSLDPYKRSRHHKDPEWDRSPSYESYDEADDEPTHSLRHRYDSLTRSPVESLTSRREGYSTYSRRSSRLEAEYRNYNAEPAPAARRTRRSPSSPIGTPVYQSDNSSPIGSPTYASEQGEPRRDSGLARRSSPTHHGDHRREHIGSRASVIVDEDGNIIASEDDRYTHDASWCYDDNQKCRFRRPRRRDRQERELR